MYDHIEYSPLNDKIYGLFSYSKKFIAQQYISVTFLVNLIVNLLTISNGWFVDNPGSWTKVCLKFKVVK